jgi:outer membrane lipoprotein SlyB
LKERSFAVKRLCFLIAVICLCAFPILAQTSGSWEIVRADYGSGNNWVDVTDRVQALVQGESLSFRVDSDTLGVQSRYSRNRALRLQLRNERGETRQVTYRDRQQVNLRIRHTYQSSLHINRAIYAAGNRSVDVTSRLNSQIQGDQLNILVNNKNMGGDPNPRQSKTLTVDYSINGSNQQATVRENDMLRLPYDDNGQRYGNSSQGSLQINRAIYGSGYRNSDVTARLNSQIQGDQLNLQVNNETMGGDPAPGQDKTLTVQYAMNGRTNQVVVKEGAALRLPYGNSGEWNGNLSQGRLQINRAIYGSGYRSSDVTARLNSQIQGDQLNLQVNNDTMGGDPAPGQDKTLTVDYSLNGRTAQSVVPEGNMLRLAFGSASQGSLQINRAVYGWGDRNSDVTVRLNSQIQGDQLNLQVNNDTMGGDPAPGQDKTLTVDYSLNGRNARTTAREGDMLRLSDGTAASNGVSPTITCESSQSGNYGRKYCAADTRNGVRLVRQIGNATCTQGSSWGYDSNGVWVDQGCRGEFEMGRSGRRSIGSSTTIPSGTEVSIRTNEAIDSSNASVGQQFSAVIAADILDGSGMVSIPKGADAVLVIRSTEGSNLMLDVDSVTVSGTRYQVSTGDVQQQGGQGVGANKKTAIYVGGGAALGTVIGAIIGGGKGAAIGAAVGAGAGLGTEVLTKGSQVKVPAETLLQFRLDQDLHLRAVR